MMIPSQSYFFVLVFLALQTLASPTLHYCRNDQRDALMEFKHEFPMNESNARSDDASLRSWNKSSDCCFWKGVTCHVISGQVISLDLRAIPLNNSLKPNSGLFKLQHLQGLNLLDCHLYGEIPSTLGNLSRLTFLGLYNNDLVGELPASIGNLAQLRHMNLQANKFSGSIPNSLGNLTKLSFLQISENQFTGKNIPLILANLTSLYSLYIGHNQFNSTLPLDMSGLHNLTYFDVGGNSFFGPFPTSLFTIPSLSFVNLWGNQLEGPIEFGNFSSYRLQYLEISQNKFNGTIPQSLYEFINLEGLNLDENNFSGLISKPISNLVKLRYLYLSQNNFTGPIPTSISKLVKLESLKLSNNKLQGQVPSYLLRVNRVVLSHNSFSSFGKPLEFFNTTTTLDLSSNSFRGPLPHWMCKLRPQVFLDLSNNIFNGSIPQCLEDSIVGLRGLSLHNNNFSGTLPDIFGNATRLVSVDISGNQLEGNIPKSLINCQNLEFLNVERNRIKDKFPSWLGTLPSLNVLFLRVNKLYGPLYHPHLSAGFQKLKVVDISHNDFTGTLPPLYFSSWHEMAILTEDGDHQMYMEDPTYINFYRISMEMVHKGVDTEFELIRNDFKAIDFSGNKFHGYIPKSIGLLKGLRLLNMSGNTFTSNVPGSLANLTNLEALDLSRNQLLGQIPQDLGSLSFLSIMNFSHNNLEGPVPRGTQFQRQNCSSFTGNPKLNGLEDICGDIHVPNAIPKETEDSMSEQDEQVINWIAAAIAYGPGVFCGLVIGHIFASHKHEWFMKKFGRNKQRAAI